MNGVHDMGGTHGSGPVEPEEDEPVFHEPWEGRMFGLMVAAGSGLFSRQAIESIEPARYLASSYYERWMLALEKRLRERGDVTSEELDDRTDFFRQHPEARPVRREDPELAERVRAGMYRQKSAQREALSPPKFRVGDPVTAGDVNPVGHTRLPTYVRGKRGVVARLNGVYDTPDTVDDVESWPPQQVYNVRFLASELWGESAEPNGTLHIDMWESYLKPHTSG